jgi:hypothetical protein
VAVSDSSRPDPASDGDNRTVYRQNITTLLFIGGLILFSVWLVDRYDRFIKMEKCVESHRRNCNPIELPPH